MSGNSTVRNFSSRAVTLQVQRADRDPVSVMEKCRDQAIINQFIEAGLQCQGIAAITAAYKYYHMRSPPRELFSGWPSAVSPAAGVSGILGHAGPEWMWFSMPVRNWRFLIYQKFPEDASIFLTVMTAAIKYPNAGSAECCAPPACFQYFIAKVIQLTSAFLEHKMYESGFDPNTPDVKLSVSDSESLWVHRFSRFAEKMWVFSGIRFYHKRPPLMIGAMFLLKKFEE
jgi:hypothetical protein